MQVNCPIFFVWNCLCYLFLYRAFDLPPSDISISYKFFDKDGTENWSPLLSDWDLDTAILGSADHDLYLQVAVMEPGNLGEMTVSDGVGDSSSLKSPVSEVGQAIAKEFEPVSKTFKQLLPAPRLELIRSIKLELVFRD